MPTDESERRKRASKGMLRKYWAILEDFRWVSNLTVILLGITGLLEGLALLALVPVLNVRLSAETSVKAMGYMQYAIEYFSIRKGYVVHAGLAVFAFLGLMTALARLATEASLLRIRTKIEENARVKMAKALLHMSWSRYLALRIGDINKAMLVEGVQMSIGAHFFLQGVGTVLVVLCYLVIAVAISAKMTIFTLFFGLVGAGGYYLAWRGSRQHTEQLSNLMANIGDEVSSIFGNLKFFRATGRSREADIKARQIYRRYAGTYFWSQIYTNLMRFGFEAGAIVFIAAFLAIALLLYQEPIGLALIFLAVFYRLAPRLLVCQDSFFQARTYLPWYDTWCLRMELAESSRETHSGQECVSTFSKLRLIDVRFQYPGRESEVLRGVNLDVAQGKCLAIVGKSGSGKSTIVDLITGLLSPDSGEVEVNGVGLAQLSLDAWRSRIGLVLQDSPLFHTSVLENIATGDERPNQSRVERAAALAHAWEFIDGLPNGIETIIGERGGMLSGGQRQRLALARALYRDPWLLILDEATSALDGHSEAVIQAALKSLKGSCTIIIVSHRLKTIDIADKIVVLEDGKVVEEGSWAELVGRRNGAFRKMAEIQGVDIHDAERSTFGESSAKARPPA